MKSLSTKDRAILVQGLDLLLDRHPKLKSASITRRNNVITFWNRYTITTNSNTNTCLVCYKFNSITREFSRRASAIAWVILDNLLRLQQAQRVLDLDRLLSGTDQELKLYEQRVKNSTKLLAKQLYITKLQAAIVRRQQIKHELDKYIILAHSAQQQGFKNEIKHTNRK